MKRSTFTLLAGFLLCVMMIPTLNSFGQNLITDNFDTYTADQKLAQQGSPNWTTWSNAPGGAEDPYVRNTQSHSSPNSVEIASSNDAVLLFNDKTSGRYQITKWLYIPSGKVGYFNLLQNFAGSSSTWGMQAYFDEGGVGSVDAGGEGTGSFFFSYNVWFPVSTVIDLDQDYATLYINNAFIVEWQWSKGAFGANNVLKLDAMNLYGWTGASGSSTPGMFVDDITFDQILAPDAPFNLTADLNSAGVTLTWEVPTGCTAIGYRVYRDGAYLGYSTTLSYIDLGVYPGEHNYYVRADYGTQLSAASNTATILIEGGTDRQFVLLEIATGTWCQYCPGAAMGADDLVANGDDVAVIEYHGGDDYEITSGLNRIGYYGIDGYPTAEFDGVSEVVGGDHSVSMFDTYQPIYEARIPVKSLFNLDLTVDWTDNTSVVATVTMEKIFVYGGDEYSLRLALTESNIPESWQGQTELDYVLRDMYPDDNGTVVDFSAGGVQTLTFPISISSSYTWENLELVAFLQDDQTMEVMQTDMFPLTMTAIPDAGKISVSVSPNPVKDLLTVRSGSPIRNITVMNSLGQETARYAANGKDLRINTSSWNSGLYFVTVKTEQGTRSVKVLKN